jgi:uncharacterized membrane protein YhaH (DUF805 family)
MNWYVKALVHYATFAGRARRKEYWMFTLVSCLFQLGLTLVDSLMSGSSFATALDSGTLNTVYSIGVLLPSLAVGVRRLHDSDRRGWWILLPIANLVFLCQDGTRGENRFGADPKARSNSPTTGAPAAGAGQARPPAARPAVDRVPPGLDRSGELERRLRMLAKLRDDGVITPEDFDRQKRSILEHFGP